MRLIRFFINLLILGGIIYFAAAVPIGQRTLWQHLRAIAQSKEGQDLVEEVKQRAHLSVGKDAGLDARPQGHAGEGRVGGNKFTEQERKLLRKIIREKLEENGEKKK